MELLGDARSIGASVVEFSGGEPTLRSDLSEIVSAAHDLGYRTKLVSNGYLLTPHAIDNLLSAGLDHLAISIDGSTAEVHGLLHQGPPRAFEHAIIAVRYAAAAGMFVKVNSVVHEGNLYDLPNLSRLCEKLGAREHRICYLTLPSRDIPVRKVPPLDWLGIVRSWMIPEIPVYVGIPFIEENHRAKTSCLLDDALPLQVMPAGDLYGCIMLVDRDLPVRSLADMHANPCALYHEVAPLGYRSVCPLRKFSLTEVRYDPRS